MVGTHFTEGQATADQLNAAIAIMRHPIIILDRDERIVAFNAAFGDLHRDPGDYCVARPGMPIAKLVEWRRENGFYAPNASEVLSDANGVPIKGEATHQLGDGRWMFVDRYGLPSGLNLGVWIDVTPMKEAEARLRATAAVQKKLEIELRDAIAQAEANALAVQAANDRLESRVEERTAQLKAAQAELLQKERMAFMGQITATVAHELRNPLSAIKNTTYSLKEMLGNTGTNFARPLERIERSVKRCDDIIAELLDYSRAHALNCRALGFDAWLREVVSEQPAPAGVTVAFDLAAPSALASIDPERFRRIVINLFDNAVQAMTGAADKSRAPRLVVSTRIDGGCIDLAIEDNGPGISPENLARVFEPLFSTKSFGTGLGLPTVKQIVEQHGGTMALTSLVGVGTCVRVRLKQAESAIAAA